jgi:hypothetical protein
MEGLDMPGVSAAADAAEIASSGLRRYTTRQAAYDLASEYPGGAEALAREIGKSPSTLQKQLRGEFRYALSVETLVDMTRASGDMRAATAFAADVGAMLVLLPDPATTPAGVLQAIGAITREVGDYIGCVTDTLADGHVTGNELRNCDGELLRLLVLLQQLQGLIRAKYEEELAGRVARPMPLVAGMPSRPMPTGGRP